MILSVIDTVGGESINEDSARQYQSDPNHTLGVMVPKIRLSPLT